MHTNGLYDEYKDNQSKIEQDFSLLQSKFFMIGASEKLSTQDAELICYSTGTSNFKNEHGNFKNYYSKLEDQNTTIETELKKEKIRQEKKDEKLDIEIHLGNFEKNQGTKFKQWNFFIVVINLLIVLSGIFISTQSKMRLENQNNYQQERIEKTIKQLKSQILILEKKIDSTYHQPTSE